MGMQIQKCKESVIFVQMHDDLSNCVNRRLPLCGWAYIASIKVYSVCVNSVVATSHSIRVENRKYIEYEIISQQSSILIVLRKLFENSSHHMRPWNLSRMNPCSNHDSLFIFAEEGRPFPVTKQIFILNLILLPNPTCMRADCHKFNWPSLNCVDDGCSMIINILNFLHFACKRVKKSIIFNIAPRIKEGEINLFIGGHCMTEWPLDPSIAIFLCEKSCTIADKLIRSRIRFHSFEDSSR